MRTKWNVSCLSTSCWKCEALSSEKRRSVCRSVQSLICVNGRGDAAAAAAAAEKQQCLQWLICKYANEWVIKIGRLSGAFWLLMNLNLQERRRGWWALNEEQKRMAVWFFFSCKKNKKKEWLSGLWNVKIALNGRKMTVFFWLTSKTNKENDNAHSKLIK